MLYKKCTISKSHCTPFENVLIFTYCICIQKLVRTKQSLCSNFFAAKLNVIQSSPTNLGQILCRGNTRCYHCHWHVTFLFTFKRKNNKTDELLAARAHRECIVVSRTRATRMVYRGSFYRMDPRFWTTSTFAACALWNQCFGRLSGQRRFDNKWRDMNLNERALWLSFFVWI